MINLLLVLFKHFIRENHVVNESELNIFV